MARLGFRVSQANVREVKGKRWVETNHNLDRIVERDDLVYGVEIKNQLAYIELGFPCLCVRELADTRLKVFEQWHAKRLST
jgi:hypothetical protein